MKNSTRKFIQFFLAIILIAGGGFGLKTLIASKPAMKKMRPTKSLPVVRTVEVRSGAHAVTLTGYGTARPTQQVQMIPQVSGKVIFVSPALVSGGAFKKGDILLKIDPVDYEIAVTLARAHIKDAESKYRMVLEEAAAARDEWEQLNSGKEPPPLVIKAPQLAAAKASLEAKRAELTKTNLQLERTHLRAPFDGRVDTKSVDIGQYVTSGQPLAGVYATSEAEVLVPMEEKDLAWFNVPGFTSDNGAGTMVMVSARIAGQQRSWPGQVMRTEGRLDERTRMVSVVVRVKDPYATRPPLMPGLFVAVVIEGRTIEDSCIIPRAALRADNIVWVVDEDKRLRFQSVDVARFSTRGVIIREGLADGDEIVVSMLKTVSDGMQVRNAPADGGQD